jgi:hypothetical protein
MTHRILIGGCSRSGTTFLQGLLARHPRIFTFPETGVFLKALGMRGTLLPWARIGLTLGKERKALAKLLDRVAQELPHPPPLPPRRLLLRPSLENVAEFLDELARAAGKDIWLEKTPRHVLHAARIRRLIPDSTFIHILRDGQDVVASMVDRARKFPEEFSRQADPAYGIRQWNRSLAATEAAMREPGHILVLYETLSTDPEATSRALCAALEVDFHQEMLERGGERGYVTGEEGWKAARQGPIRPAISKFPSVFDEPAQARINKGLETGFYEVAKERCAGSPGGVWMSSRPG